MTILYLILIKLHLDVKQIDHHY